MLLRSEELKAWRRYIEFVFGELYQLSSPVRAESFSHSDWQQQLNNSRSTSDTLYVISAPAYLSMAPAAKTVPSQV